MKLSIKILRILLKCGKTKDQIRKKDFSRADFSEADFSEADFSEADFSEANFLLANFSLANFSLANFSLANFSLADFSKAIFLLADFLNINLNNCKFDFSVYTQSLVGSANRSITYIPKFGIVFCGCSTLRLSEFRKKVKTVHANNKIAREYQAIIRHFINLEKIRNEK